MVRAMGHTTSTRSMIVGPIVGALVEAVGDRVGNVSTF